MRERKRENLALNQIQKLNDLWTELVAHIVLPIREKCLVSRIKTLVYFAQIYRPVEIYPLHLCRVLGARENLSVEFVRTVCYYIIVAFI